MMLRETRFLLFIPRWFARNWVAEHSQYFMKRASTLSGAPRVLSEVEGWWGAVEGCGSLSVSGLESRPSTARQNCTGAPLRTLAQYTDSHQHSFDPCVLFNSAGLLGGAAHIAQSKRCQHPERSPAS